MINKMNDIIRNNKKKFIIGILIILLLLIIGFSYAWLMTSLQGEKDISILVNTIDLELDESASEGIHLVNAIPTYDDEGKVSSPYKFSLVNKSDIDLYYSLSLIDDEELIDSCQTTDGSPCELLDSRDVRYEVKVGNDYQYLDNMGTLSDSPVIYHGVINAKETVDCELRVWININAGNDAMGKAFLGKLNVFATQQVAEDKFIQDNEEVNEPDMDSNMIAVRHDGYNWVKTDKENGWYNYGRGIWANAVTVRADKLSTYQGASVGTVISMDDIETMWVWIPRYSYTITSEDGTNYYGKRGVYLSDTPTRGLPGEIDIKFIGTDVKEKGTARYSNTEAPKNWYTPDAFTFGDEELSGIWVGKFETSNTTQSQSNSTTPDPIIKPNVSSWRNINVSNIYNVGLKVSAEGNRYGFNSSMNSHTMRNDEWGAVAYLSQSAYGKLGNVNFLGTDKEVYQNKSNSFITGCSSGLPSANGSQGCPYTYDDNTRDESGVSGKGVGASTTGTIYGVYDMSGGSWEYVMGNYNDIAASSGFSEPLTLEGKYYNKYTSNIASEACNGGVCYSHALSETAGWYNDDRTMVSETSPWLVRGGNWYNNSNAGVFCFYHTIALGGTYGNYSFRLVMSPSP